MLDDLSVLENLRVALPARVFQGGDPAAIARGMLADVGLAVDVHLRADALTVAQKHLLEIAKALATRPPVLILDEPTAALDQDATEMLFDRIRAVVAQGTAVIYITDRLAELRQIAHPVTPPPKPSPFARRLGRRPRFQPPATARHRRRCGPAPTLRAGHRRRGSVARPR